MCDWVTLLYRRKLTEHYKPTIIEKIKIIKKKTSSALKKQFILRFYYIYSYTCDNIHQQLSLFFLKLLKLQIKQGIKRLLLFFFCCFFFLFFFFFYHHSNFFFWHVLDLSLLPSFGNEKAENAFFTLTPSSGSPTLTHIKPHHPTIVVEIKRRHKGVRNGSASQAVGSLHLRDTVG